MGKGFGMRARGVPRTRDVVPGSVSHTKKQLLSPDLAIYDTSCDRPVSTTRNHIPVTLWDNTGIVVFQEGQWLLTLRMPMKAMRHKREGSWAMGPSQHQRSRRASCHLCSPHGFQGFGICSDFSSGRGVGAAGLRRSLSDMPGQVLGCLVGGNRVLGFFARPFPSKRLESGTIGALTSRIGFWGPIYYNYN